MAIDPSIIASGIAVAGSIGNTALQGGYAGKNKRQAEKMQKWTHDINLTDWGLENEYNSPKNQMKRLKEAGLNPNLIYGSGGAGMTGGSVNSTGNSSSNQDAPQFDMTGVIKMFIDLQMLDKQKDLIQAQMEATRTNEELSRVGIARGEQDMSMKNSLFPGQLTALELGNKKTIAELEKIAADTQFTLDANERAAAMQAPNLEKAAEEILNLRKSRAKTDAEISHINQQIENLKQDVRLKLFDEELQKKGIPRNSPGWYGALIKGLSAIGQPLTEEEKELLIKSGFKINVGQYK